jgi:hypothetical protein
MRQPDIPKLASDILSVELNTQVAEEVDTQLSAKGSQSRRKTLDEIKDQVKLQEGSSVSFVIVGTVNPFGLGLTTSRSCRCWQEHPDGKAAL